MKTWKVCGLAGLVVTGIFFFSGPSQAQFFGRGIDRREAAQQQRILHGIHSGALTPHEAGRLAAEQRRIQASEERMRADGRLDYRERARLDRLQDKAGRHIYRENHDNHVAHARYHNHHKPHKGHHYAPRHHGPYLKAACGSNHGHRGRFHPVHKRDHRFAWNN